MFCANCGAKMPDDAKFCTECGTKVAPKVEEKAAPVEEKATVVEEKVAPAEEKATVVEEKAAPAEEKKASTIAEELKAVTDKKEVPKAAPIPMPNKQNHEDKGIFQEYIEDIQKFNCNGRMNRLKYWKYIGVNMVIVFVVGMVLSLIGVGDKIASIFSSVMSILFIPFSIRRLHDLNKSGWFLLIGLIPVINFFWAIYVLFFKGTEGPNQYGDDPLAGL